MADETPDIQFKLRLPADLHGRLEQVAAAAGRSISAEIVHRLSRSMKSIEDLVIEHRLEETQVNGWAIFDLERKRDHLQDELEQCRGPGQMDRRRELLGRINDLTLRINMLSKFHRKLDDEIEAVRNGDLPQAAEP